MSKGKHTCTYCKPGACRPTWLYVVADADGAGPVKVGISFHATKRLAMHRKKTKRNLAVHWKRQFSCEFAAIEAEDAVCDALDAYRTRGDWFDLPVSEIIELAEVAQR